MASLLHNLEGIKAIEFHCKSKEMAFYKLDSKLDSFCGVNKAKCNIPN
jgi:hypothetical protein